MAVHFGNVIKKATTWDIVIFLTSPAVYHSVIWTGAAGENRMYRQIYKEIQNKNQGCIG